MDLKISLQLVLSVTECTTRPVWSLLNVVTWSRGHVLTPHVPGETNLPRLRHARRASEAEMELRWWMVLSTEADPCVGWADLALSLHPILRDSDMKGGNLFFETNGPTFNFKN